MFGLNPKQIILTQLKARFEKVGLTRLVLTYNLTDSTATCQGKLKDKNVQVVSKDKKVTFTDVIDIPLEKKELTMIQKFLISKITEKTKNCSHLYIEFNMIDESLTMCVRDNETGKLIPIKLQNE